MRIQQFIDQLSDEHRIEYRGKRNMRIRGFSQKAARRHVRRRFYILPEHDWHPGKPEIFRSLENTPEEEIERALNNGAAGVVCPNTLRDNPLLLNRNCFFVEDTKRFFYLAATILRGSMKHQKLILVTGSVGKSTTRRMIAHALQAIHEDKTVRPKRGNANLSTFVLREITAAPMFDYSVIEAAASAFRGFEKEGFTPSPDVSVITSIAEAHLKTYRTTRNVAKRKSDIFAASPAGGGAVINIDVPHADVLLERADREGRTIYTYGESPKALVRLVNYDYTTGIVTVSVNGLVTSFSLAAPGKHMALNSLAVIATLLALDEPEWEYAVQRLDDFAPGWGRGRLREVNLSNRGTVQLIDESHNANPASMRAALEAFAHRSLPHGCRRLAILGDMLELGNDADALHIRVAESEALGRLDEVHLFGQHMPNAKDAFARLTPEVRHWSSLKELERNLLDFLRPGDYVLAKASLDTGLSTVINRLVEDGQVDEH